MGLDTVELVMMIEDEFSIAIPDAEAERMLTVGDIYDFILKKLENQNPDRQVIWERLKMIFVQGFGVSPGEITKEARVVADLGLN